MKKLPLYILRLLGALYIFAGVGKFVSSKEGDFEKLSIAAIANKGTLLDGASRWFVEHQAVLITLIGAILIVIGGLLVLNRFLVRTILVGSLLMLSCFMVVLHRGLPVIFLVDLPFTLMALYLLFQKSVTFGHRAHPKVHFRDL